MQYTGLTYAYAMITPAQIPATGPGLVRFGSQKDATKVNAEISRGIKRAS